MNSSWVAPFLLGLLLAQRDLSAASAVEAWLPQSTVAMFVVPDANGARARFKENPWYRLWLDPTMLPFRDRCVTGMRADLLDPFREQAGWDLPDGIACVQGAFCVALLAPADGQVSLSSLECLALADLGSKSGVVQHFIEVRWPESATVAETVPMENHEGILFRLVPVPWPPTTSAQAPTRLWVGLTNDWLIAGSRTDTLAALARRMRDGSGNGLDQNAEFARDYRRSLRGSTVYGWANLRPWIGAMLRLADAADAEEPKADSVPMPPKRRMLEVSGLTALTTLSFSAKEDSAGTRTEIALGVPLSSRRGLLKMLELPARDASPPSYVGTDVVRFDRFRIDFGQTWTAFERMLTDLFPQASGVLDLLFKTAGPAGESGDLRKDLLALLGSDLVSYEYAPTSARPTALARPPRVIRLSSTNAAQLALSLKALTVLLPPPLTEVEVETWQGHELYAVQVPRLSLRGELTPDDRRWSFGALTDSVAFCSERPLLERLLAEQTSAAGPLLALPGLAEASEQVGGMGVGGFRYYNVARAMPWRLTALRRETNLWQSLPALGPVPSIAQAPLARFNSWFDPRLLPPFENIAEYFGFTVASAGADADGLFYRTFSPYPPRLEPEKAPPSTPPPPPPAAAVSSSTDGG